MRNALYYCSILGTNNGAYRFRSLSTRTLRGAMRSLALYVYTHGQGEEGVSRTDLLRFMKEYLLKKRFEDSDVAEKAANEFIDFCEGRAWVLTDVGADLYGFTHRTFLEYFAASQLARENASADRLADVLIPRIKAGEWDVVAQLAVQILGKNVEDGSDDFLVRLNREARASKRISHRSNLISFGGRALEFLVPPPPTIRSLVQTAVTTFMRMPRSRGTAHAMDRMIGDFLAPTAENLPVVAGAIRGEALGALEKPTTTERGLSLLLVPPRGALAAEVIAGRVIRRTLRHDSAMQWQDWSLENYRGLGSKIPKLRKKYFWLSVIEFEMGAISASQLLSEHGAAALFEYEIGGAAFHPPLGYRFVLADRNGHGLSGLLTRIEPEATSNLSTELAIRLQAEPTPWVEERAAARGVPGSVFIRQDMGKPSPTSLLVFLAAIEAQQRYAGRGRGLVRALADARNRAIPVEQALELVDKAELPAEVRRFTERWLRGDVSIIRSPADGTTTRVSRHRASHPASS
jgi:hypothetical protein